MAEIAELQQRYLMALRQGDEQAAAAVVDEAQRAGLTPEAIYYAIFAPSMVTIGELWERNELSVAEEHLATAITERLIGRLSPLFERPADRPPPGTALVGCVAGEQHALGATMLADLLRAHGWRVLALGADVPTHDWTRLAQRFNVALVAISASLDQHVATVREVIAALRAALPEVCILVGGNAFRRDADLWRSVGADLYHPDARVAVELATAQVAHRRQDACAGGPTL